MRKCPQEVRGIEVMRLLGDKENPYNRMKKELVMQICCLNREEKTKK